MITLMAAGAAASNTASRTGYRPATHQGTAVRLPVTQRISHTAQSRRQPLPMASSESLESMDEWHTGPIGEVQMAGRFDHREIGATAGHDSADVAPAQ